MEDNDVKQFISQSIELFFLGQKAHLPLKEHVEGLIKESINFGQESMKQKAITCVPEEIELPTQSNANGFCTICHYFQCKCAGSNRFREQTLQALSEI